MARPGPAFWAATYGIDSYEEFFSRVEPWLPDSVGYLVHLKDDQVAHIAYEDPLSGFGGYLSTVLGIAEVVDPQSPAPKNAALRGLAGLAQSGDGLMAPLVIPNVYRVAIEALSGGQSVVNVVGVKGSSSGQATAAANAVKAAWEAAGGPAGVLQNTYAVQNYRSMDLSSVDGGIANVGSTKVGGGASALATNGACALVKWNGGTRSGSSRGRLYFGPLSESQINSDGRTVAASSLTTITTAFTAFRDSLSGAGFPLHVISRTRAEAFAVTSIAVESVLASQRRRIR